jgi:myo-inositol-1-phosphate synthase
VNCSGGALNGPSAYYMKSPPLQFTDDQAQELVEAFIRGDAEADLEAALQPVEAAAVPAAAGQQLKPQAT